MKINQMLENLQSTKLYYDAALIKCRYQYPSIVFSFRKEHKWTQAKLASLLNVTDSYISKMERGHCSPSIPVLLRLAEMAHELKEIDNDIAKG